MVPRRWVWTDRGRRGASPSPSTTGPGWITLARMQGLPGVSGEGEPEADVQVRVAGGSAVSVIVRKNGISGNATSSFAVRQRSSTASRPTVSSGCSPGPTCLPVGNHRPGLDGHTAVSIILAGPAGRFQ